MSRQINQLLNGLIEKGEQKLKIDLKSQLLNCDLEEIQGIFYQLSEIFKKEASNNNSKDEIDLKEIEIDEIDTSSNKKKNEEELIEFVNPNFNSFKDKIFEKIIPTLSQDIIFFAKNSNFVQKNKPEFEKILNIYLKDEYQHKNFKSYLERINTNKHLIYTFSNILDSIFGLNNEMKLIKNENYGSFKKEKTRNIFVEQYNSERAIDEKIFDFYNDENYNLCIFHFDSYDCIHLNHINYLIQNIENTLITRNNLQSKVIVFIIHLKRKIIGNDETNEKIHNEYFISHLTQWKQFFIDNLNGKDINIKEIVENSTFELFNNQNLIDLNEEFKKDLFHAFTSISYNIKINFSDIKEKEYIEKICDLIHKDDKLKKVIKNKILNKIKDMKDNLILKIFIEYNFEDNDVDLITVIIKQMKSIYNKELTNTLIQLEKNNILSTKLLSEKEMKNEIFDKIYEDYFSNNESSNENYTSFSQNIQIDLIIGLSYPYIISVFQEINNYTNLIIDEYLEINDDIDDKDYSNNKNRLEKNIQKEFEKQYFAEIINNQNSNLKKMKLGEFLFKDYIIYYLSKSKDKITNKNILTFFNCFFEIYSLLKYDENIEIFDNENKEIFNIENISKFILFIESYKDYIYPFIHFICSIDSYINDFLNYFIPEFKNFEIKNRKISNPKLILIRIFESIVFSILNSDQKFEAISNDDLENFLNEITVFSNFLMKTNNELSLILKQILFLFDFIQVKEILNKNGISLKENLPKYLSILQKENAKYLLPQYFNKENENINEEDEIIYIEFQFLKEKISHLEEYPDLIIKLLNNKMKISKDENYRIQLLKIFCSNNLFIIKSPIILETIFKRYEVCPRSKNKKEEEKEEKEEKEEEEEDEEEDEDDDSRKTGLLFLSYLNEKKNSLIIQFLNRINNIYLDEVLLNFFDGKFSIYFKNKKSNEDKLLNQSLKIFKKCVYYIENENCTISENNRIGILYCISYIKYYCYYFSKLISEEEFEEIPKNEIYEFLNVPNKLRNVIKLYIFKILNLIVFKNYHKFLDFIQEKGLFYNDFDFKEKIPCSLNYLFIQNDSINYYKTLRKIYILSKTENYKYTNKILKIIDETKIFNFYDLIINEEICNLITNYNRNSYKKLTHFISDIQNKLNLPQITKDILSLYFDFNSIQNKIFPLIKDLPQSDYEILLYSHKLTLICSTSNTIYSKILSPNILNNISNIYIPGGEPNDSRLIESGEQIKKYIENGGSEAIYMCSCYYWYTIANCGRPVVTFPCKICSQLLGGVNYILNKREGHVRIYPDNSNNLDNRNNYKMYSQLMNEVENERNKHFKGFKKVEYSFFINKDKKVRNISNVTYRILNFIFYSYIFYSEKLGYLDKNTLNNFYFSDGNEQINSILFILKKDWELLIEELAKRQVNNIQCFLNMIIPELSKIISENDKNMTNPNERNEFENLCDNVIENAIANYNDYYKIYNKNNKEILEMKDESIKSILEETSDINNLSNEIYPLINYFYTANYTNYEKFYEEFISIPNNNIKYPVIMNYLNYSQDEIFNKFFESFKLINPFVNYVIEKYSNKITREEAKNKLIKNEIKNDENMKKLFNDFKKGWEKIYKNLSNYDCHGQLPEKNITEDDCLAYCLNDNLEDNYGKYIATAYKDFITYQNNFLKSLIENNINNEYLYEYSNQIKKEIIVQRAKKEEIVSLEIENELFDSFEDLVIFFSYRNFFNENGNINYLNYKQNKFDFYSIEVELSKILLPQKRLFKNEQIQDFIIYAFENFNNNSNIILDFIEKIKKMELLSNDEKANLNKIIKNIDYKLILFNLQSLFLYFVNKKNINGNEILNDEIKNLPTKIIKLDNEFIDIFTNRQIKIKLNQLIDFYEYIELLNYDKILKNVSEKAKNKLTQENINRLNKHFENNAQLLINKKELGNAIRKFICRYLIGDLFKNFEWNIFDLIKDRTELWNQNFLLKNNEKKFEKEIERLVNIGIIIGQSVDFYEKLGGERIMEKPNNKKSNENKKKNKNKRKEEEYDYY